MTIEFRETYTAAGAQAAKDIDTTKIITFGITADNPAIDADVEVQLTDGGNWYKAFTNLPNGEAKTTNGGIKAIRLNIIALNGATTVDWEVVGDRQ